jgi:hypothetical protein
MINTKQSMGTWLRKRLSSWRVISIVGAIYLVFQVVVATILHPLDALTVLKLQTSFSADVFVDIVQGWRDTGLIDAYGQHFYFDFILPILYSILMCAVLSKCFDANGIQNRYDTLLLLPFVAAGCDFIENVSHVVFLLNSDAITPTAVALSAFVCNMKWMLVLGFLIAITALSFRSQQNKTIEVGL